MKTQPTGGDTRLFDELRRRGFSVRRAAQLQNLYTYRGFTSVIFAEEGGDFQPSTFNSATLCMAMPGLDDKATRALVGQAEGSGAAICLIGPWENRARRALARYLVDAHRHTSVDNRGFLLLFTDERLPKQHFKL